MTGIYINLLVIFLLFAVIQASGMPLNLPLIPNVDITTYGFERKINFNYKVLHDSLATSVRIASIAGQSDGRGDRVMHMIQFTPRFRKVSWKFFVVLDPAKYQEPFETYGFKDTSIFIHVSTIPISNLPSSVFNAIVLAQRIEARVHFLFPYEKNMWRNYIVPDIRSPIGTPFLVLLETVTSNSFMVLEMTPSLTLYGNKVGVDGRKYQSCEQEFRRKTCSEHFRFVSTAERYFNFTTVYVSYQEIDHYLIFNNAHNSIHSFISQDRYVVQYRIRENSALCFLRDAEDYFLLYCENELRALSSSSVYWISPLDTSVWVLLALSLTFSAAITSIKTERTFIFTVIDLIGTLIRQISKRKMFFLQVVLSFMGFFIITPYESVVTSDVTVPLPPHIVRDLRELIVDRGYKMFFPIINISKLAGYDLHEFSDGFNKYNLSDVFFLSFQGFDYANDTSVSCLARKKNNLATDVGQSELGWVVMKFQSEAEERFCHVVPEPFFRRYFATLVRGRGHEKIVRFLFLAREVGILGFWYRNNHWLTEYRHKIRLLARQNVNSAENGGLGLSEKVTEIFQTFVAGVCISAFCLVGEFVWYFMKKSGNTTVVIL
jgi:hypothetical protein